MKISSIRAISRNIRLRSPFRFASYELSHLPYAWVRVETESGLVGYGECPTYWDPSGETQLAAVGAIQHMAPTLIGMDAFDLESVFRAFDREAYGAFAAKCGLDMALYDIVGQGFRVPVYKLLGGGSARVLVNAVLPMGVDKQLESRIADLVERGYSTFKVKVGLNPSDELQLVERAIRLLPKESIVFVDANQGWRDAKTAIRAIRKFDALGVSWVEQPVLAHDVQGLRLVRESVNASIIADESLYTHVDALRLVREDAVDMFNVKLAKCGGMYLGKKLVAVAQSANIGLMLGSMIESGLGMLANYHFARAQQMMTCGLSAYALVDDDIDVGLSVVSGQLLKGEDRPGLGYPDGSVFERLFCQ